MRRFLLLGDEDVFSIARDAVGKDSHERWTGDKTRRRQRAKSSVRPAALWIDKEEPDLIVANRA